LYPSLSASSPLLENSSATATSPSITPLAPHEELVQNAPLKGAALFGTGLSAYFPNAMQLTTEEKSIVTRYVQNGGRALSVSNKDLGGVTHIVIGANARDINGDEAVRVKRYAKLPSLSHCFFTLNIFIHVG
jgi:hypothetical protein